MKFNHLFQGEDKLIQKILNSIGEGVIVANKDGDFLFFNSIAENILGIGMRKIDPEKWGDVYGCFYPDKKTPFPSEQIPLAQTLKTGKAANEILFIKNPHKSDGVFIDIVSTPILGDNDDMWGGIVIFKDISETIKSNNLLKQSEERFKELFKGIPIPTFVWQHENEDFTLIDYNDAASTLSHGKIKSYVGMKYTTMYPDLSSPLYQDLWHSYKERTIVNREITHRLRSTNQEKELDVRHVYIAPDLVVVHAEDITERKNAEKTLKKLSSAVEQTADAVLITTEKGIIEYVNPAFMKMSGYTREEAIGQTPRLLKSGKHEKSFYQEIWATLLAGDPYQNEMLNRKKNGEYFWVQNTITPMKDENGTITNFVAVHKDITDLKARHEQEIRLKVAREIQQRLYSSTISIPGFNIAGKNFSAEETSGDYFDVFSTSDETYWLTIGDVSGHGVGSALIMAETRAYLRVLTKLSSDPGTVLSMLNKELHTDLDELQYVTLILVRLDVTRNQIAYASAGHVPGYILNNKGEVEHVLDSTGIPLGFLKNQEYENGKTINIAAKNMLVFLTDGIVEAQDDDDAEFGHERILNIIKNSHQMTAGQIIEHLYQKVSSFSRDIHPLDDMTALICKME
ncbi:SpoIIE family protein phosphatase [candidate division KSB1 bacterium]|nr:SpoIIE family protein phosphatase [candidate division KSB1 bacterium]